uniref:LIM zinc-binding domain-containing protein n=1 Tax=Macrostomum lignano TaxID=282301 RepID=A0A1I8GTS1_9PLAT
SSPAGRPRQPRSRHAAPPTPSAGHSKLYTLASVFNEKAPPDYTKISALYPQRQQDESYRYKPAGGGGGGIVLVSPHPTGASQGSISIPVSVQRRLQISESQASTGAASPSSATSAGGGGSGAVMTMSLYDGVTSSGELVSNYLEGGGPPQPQPLMMSAAAARRANAAAAAAAAAAASAVEVGDPNAMVGDESEDEPVCFRCRRCLPAGLALQLAALNAFFHPYCFLCYQCQAPLTQTSSFYHAAGRLLCEGCVNDALEMCDACRQPVTERILRALGKPYHPACFRCTQCRRKLDGQGFTVDVHNRVLCLDDFHRKYAPRCAACRQPITPARGQTETRRV